MTLMLMNAGFRVARAIYAESHLRDSWHIVSAAGLDEGDCGRLAGDWQKIWQRLIGMAHPCSPYDNTPG